MPYRLSCAVVAVLALGILCRDAPGQVRPEESARQVRPAEGLDAALWAAEPMVVNPTNIDIDSRGRVWVAEGLNYRETLHRGQARVPDADKIKILEDTDGDGKADKLTVFADSIFPVPMGIAVEEHYDGSGKYAGCRVYIGNSPDLLVLEDTDGDDKADRRYPLLTGFGGYDHDHGVHGMTFGPDGKIYFTQGDNTLRDRPGLMFEVLDKSGRKVANDQLATTLRVNRDGTQFEILADRQRNNYETCLNAFGNVFTSDNDDDGNRGSRVIWVLEGGRYGYRTPGSPRHWAEEIPGNVPKLVGTGNGSPCGILVYEGDLLPRAYYGSLLEVDAGTRTVYHFPLTRKGSAFRTETQTFLTSDDPWFRPVDACVAPDGSVFVADWYDAGVGGHAFRDQTTGRIYRVRPKGTAPGQARHDFSTTAGRIAALKSPNVAARDVAQRMLIAQGQAAVPALTALFRSEAPAEQRARALWTVTSIDAAAGRWALRDPDPRLRELGVRIHGRDVSRVGRVETAGPLPPPRGEQFLDVLLPLVDDPDAGVRRELILAIRDVPTEKVGSALATLAASWDGQDRWYLEALGLALRDRESAFLAKLFDGTLYGPLDLDENGTDARVALPPYFPVDRNEAYLSVSDPDLPANSLTRTLGLMWMVHRAEVLPLLSRILPGLKSPELQQAAEDVLLQIRDPAGAVAVADLVLKSDDPIRARRALATLARRLEGPWKPARGEERIHQAIEAGLADPALKAAAVETAAATQDRRYVPALAAMLEAEQHGPEARAATVEALSRLDPQRARQTFETLIHRAIESRNSDPLSEAAVRSLPRLGEVRRLERLVTDENVPLGLRREAAQGLITANRAMRLLDLVEAGSLPEDLKPDLTIALSGHPERNVRERAVRLLPRPRLAGGKPLPPFFELVRRDGDPERGRAVFFSAGPARQEGGTQSCGSCHRVRGRGEWVGPDLSTIGTKYGKDELLRSILTPSAAIGYNLRAWIIATTDGRTLTGLPVEESAERVVLKTASGERVGLRPSEIQEKRFSEVSLMPEGLAETLGEQDLVDLLAYLAALRQPVSIIGQFQAAGPLPEPEARTLLEQGIDPRKSIGDGTRRAYPWRRVTANAEGLIDLAPLAGAGVVILHAPVSSPVAQPAELVLDTNAAVSAWLGGAKLPVPGTGGDATRSVAVALPRGRTDLLLAVPAGSALVATMVAERPVEFVDK